MRYHPNMSEPPYSVPGFARHGIRFRVLVSLDRADAERIADEADRLAIPPGDVIRGVVRGWCRHTAPPMTPREVEAFDRGMERIKNGNANGGGNATKGNK